MVDSTLRTAAPIARLPSAAFGVVLPRLIAGAVILLTWETVVRLFAPPYVAKPTTIADGDPARASWIPLSSRRRRPPWRPSRKASPSRSSLGTSSA